MAASNKNELPLEDQSEDDSATGAEPAVPMEVGDEPQPDNAASVEPVADDVTTGEEDADATDEDTDTDDDLDVSEDPDADADEDFQPVPMRTDEFVVSLSRLGKWQHHPRRGSRFFGAHEKALLLSAADPASLRPIVVLPAVDGKVTWLDPATGYECIMMRDNPAGFLSGYVGVPLGHPLFGWDHDAVPADLGIEVHGGLTYGRICQEGPSPRYDLLIEVRRICHVVVGVVHPKHATEYRAHDDQWWFGFQCDHVYDVVPGDRGHGPRFMGAETTAEYRDDGYVIREVLNLAGQLRAIADGLPVPPRDGPPLPALGLDPKRGG